MTELNLENRSYNYICKEAHSISLEVERHGLKVRGFEDYICDLNVLQRQYVKDFLEMSSTQRSDAYLLLNMVKEQIHCKLDVLRVRVMRGEVKKKSE